LKKFKKLAYIALILIIAILSFCIYKVYAKNNQDDDIKEKSFADIKYLEKEFTNLFNEVNNIKFENYTILATDIEEKKSSQELGQKSGQSSGGSSEKNSSSETSKEDSSSEQEKTKNKQYQLKKEGILTQNSEPDWNQIKNDVEKIYTILYSITVDLHQTVDNKENIAKFTNEYDKLVKAVKEENKQETLKELSELYNFLAGFIDDFSTHKKDGIVIKTKNDVFKAYSILDNEDWESVTDSINSATQNFARISVDVKDLNNKDTGKSKGKNDDQNISKYNVNKAYMMIEELQNAINLKEKEIFLIKYKNLLEELENVWYNF